MMLLSLIFVASDPIRLVHGLSSRKLLFLRNSGHERKTAGDQAGRQPVVNHLVRCRMRVVHLGDCGEMKRETTKWLSRRIHCVGGWPLLRGRLAEPDEGSLQLWARRA